MKNYRARLEELTRQSPRLILGPCPACGHDGGDGPRVYVSQVKADGSPIDWGDPDHPGGNPTPEEVRDCPRCRREALHVIIHYVDRRERRVSL